jgi:hypothetical protein
VPEGAYVLTAMAQDSNSATSNQASQFLAAVLPIQLNKDTSGLVLTLVRGAMIDVTVNDQIPGQGELHQVRLTLSSTEFPQMSKYTEMARLRFRE